MKGIIITTTTIILQKYSFFPYLNKKNYSLYIIILTSNFFSVVTFLRLHKEWIKINSFLWFFLPGFLFSFIDEDLGVSNTNKFCVPFLLWYSSNLHFVIDLMIQKVNFFLFFVLSCSHATLYDIESIEEKESLWGDDMVNSSRGW